MESGISDKMHASLSTIFLHLLALMGFVAHNTQASQNSHQYQCQLKFRAVTYLGKQGPGKMKVRISHLPLQVSHPVSLSWPLHPICTPWLTCGCHRCPRPAGRESEPACLATKLQLCSGLGRVAGPIQAGRQARCYTKHVDYNGHALV